jgi:hypothetical protein
MAWRGIRRRSSGGRARGFHHPRSCQAKVNEPLSERDSPPSERSAGRDPPAFVARNSSPSLQPIYLLSGPFARWPERGPATGLIKFLKRGRLTAALPHPRCGGPVPGRAGGRRPGWRRAKPNEPEKSARTNRLAISGWRSRPGFCAGHGSESRFSDEVQACRSRGELAAIVLGKVSRLGVHRNAPLIAKMRHLCASFGTGMRHFSCAWRKPRAGLTGNSGGALRGSRGGSGGGAGRCRRLRS